MLLPEPFREGGPREFFVAVQQAEPWLVGAACFRYGGATLFSVRVRVLRTHRRRGIGSALLRRIIQEARARGCKAVLARTDPEAEPDAAPFLEAHGFQRRGRLVKVEAEIEQMRAWFSALRDRLLAAGKVPSSARVVPYREAPKDQVARLYAEYILNSPDLQAGRIEHWLEHLNIQDSPVALVGDQVVGLLLWFLDGSVGTVPARVVAPGHRGAWVNALLMAEALEAGWAAGGRRVRFEIPAGNHDTEKLARRLGAKQLQIVDCYALAVEGGSNEGS